MKYGVDLSCFDNNIDYDTFKQNIDFAIIRVGYGIQTRDDQIDSLLDIHYNNLKYDVPLGAYYYGYARTYEEGRQEAENCLEYMAEKTFELPIFYDLEKTSRNTMDCANGFVDRIREAGLKAGIYCMTSFYNSTLEGVDCDCLWLAEYGSNNGEIPSSEPRFDYDIWQYSSLGTYDGWNRRGDVDIAKDYVIDEMEPTPAPTPQPQPTPQGEIAEIQQWLNDTYNTGIEVNNEWNDYTYSSLVSGLQIELNRQFGRNLVVDGIYGAKTSDAYCTLRRGARGNITRILQGILICKGYNQGGFDGIFRKRNRRSSYEYATRPRTFS